MRAPFMVFGFKVIFYKEIVHYFIFLALVS